jgi:hypothetical protein
MKYMMTAFLAMILALPVLAFAQSGQMQNDQQTQSGQMQNDQRMQQQAQQATQVDQTGQTTLAKHTMTGMVSDNGKGFTSDNTTYVVNNPKALKKYENQNVSVQFQFNTNNNTIHIISATPAQSQ